MASRPWPSWSAAGSTPCCFTSPAGPNRVLTFCADLRRNARLYNLPVALLCDEDVFEDAEIPFAAGATEVLPVDTAADDVAFRLHNLVRQQRYRRVMQEVYGAARHFATSDSLTGSIAAASCWPI